MSLTDGYLVKVNGAPSGGEQEVIDAGTIVSSIVAPGTNTRVPTEAALINYFASKTNVLAKDNTTAFTPTTDYHPATKKYVDDSVSDAGGGDMLKTTYDPTSVEGDAFSMANMAESATEKILTDTERTKLNNLSGTNTGDQDLSTLALKSNVLELDNTDAFTPDADYEPATKKYVDDNVVSGGMLASTYDPADISEQLVGLTAAQILTNKTLTSPIINNPTGIDMDDLNDGTTFVRSHNDYTDADKTKMDYLTVTQAVDLDQMETDISALANGMVYKGNWDASSGVFPGSGSAQTGWFYYVNVAGTVDSIAFDVGDNIVATTDDASTTTYTANWSKHDQTDAVQSVAGLVGTITASGLRSAIDFDTEVSNNADVTANTAKETNATHTGDATGDGALTIATDLRTVQIDFVIPGSFMDGRSVADDLLEKVNSHLFLWRLRATTLKSFKAVVGVDDTGGTQPSINIEIGGVEALSSDLTLAETWSTGTIDTANDDVATDDRVEITVAGTGTNSDAEDLTVSTVWEVTSV